MKETKFSLASFAGLGTIGGSLRDVEEIALETGLYTGPTRLRFPRLLGDINRDGRIDDVHLLTVIDSIDLASTATSGVSAPTGAPDAFDGERRSYLGGVEILVGDAGRSTSFRLSATGDVEPRGSNAFTFDSYFDLDDPSNSGYSAPPVPHITANGMRFDVQAVAVPEPVAASGSAALFISSSSAAPGDNRPRPPHVARFWK